MCLSLTNSVSVCVRLCPPSGWKGVAGGHTHTHRQTNTHVNIISLNMIQIIPKMYQNVLCCSKLPSNGYESYKSSFHLKEHRVKHLVQSYIIALEYKRNTAFGLYKDTSAE